MLLGRAAPKAPAEPPCLRLAAGCFAPPPPIGQKPASGATFGVHPPTVPCERGQPAEPSEQRGKALPAPPLRWKETRPAPAATGAQLSGCCCHRRCQPRSDSPGLYWLNKQMCWRSRTGRTAAPLRCSAPPAGCPARRDRSRARGRGAPSIRGGLLAAGLPPSPAPWVRVETGRGKGEEQEKKIIIKEKAPKYPPNKQTNKNPENLLNECLKSLLRG